MTVPRGWTRELLVLGGVALAAHLVLQVADASGFYTLHRSDRSLAMGETAVFVLLLMGGAIMLREGPRGLDLHAPLTRGEIAGWAGLHVVLVGLVGALVTDWGPFTDDEEAYRVGAASLLQGMLPAPAPLPEGAWTNEFVVAMPRGDSLHWASVYPLLASVWTLPGEALGFPNLLWVPLGALLVVQTTAVARHLFDGAPARTVAAVLATSPLLIGLSAFKHTSLLAALWATTAAELALAPRRPWRDLATGAAIGLAVLTRPLDSVVVLGGVTLLVVAQRRSWSDAGLRLARIALGGLPFVPVFLWYNLQLTGSPLQLPYSLLAPGESVYGFGATAYGPHTVGAGLQYVFVALTRLNAWAFGWPLALVVPILALVSGHPAARWLAALLVAHVVLYVPAPFGQVATVGLTYSVWALPVLALLLGALVAEDADTWVVRVGRLSVLGWLVFVPWETWRLGREMHHNNAPLRAARALADRHGPVVVLYDHLRAPPEFSFVYHPPLPVRPAPAAIWWAGGGAAESSARQAHPDRSLFHATWTDDRPPRLAITPLGDPVTRPGPRP